MTHDVQVMIFLYVLGVLVGWLIGEAIVTRIRLKKLEKEKGGTQ